MAANLAASEEFRIWLETQGNLRFKEALKLSKEGSGNDRETEPYKSKYAAREILLNIKNKLESFIVDECELKLILISVKCAVHYELGLNHIETDEISTGERYLNGVKENFEEYKLKPEFCIVMVKCLQQLGMIWNERGDIEKCLAYFTDAEILYNEYTAISEVAPWNTDMLFAFGSGSNSGKESEFESLHTHTFYYLTQAYKNNGQNKKSAEYGHKTLQRQLSTKIYDPVDWAVNCATLSQYHLTQGDYTSAKHCLAAASCIIVECGNYEEQASLDVENEGEEDRKQRERIPEAKANVALCWSKYFLNLLKLSAESEYDEDTDQPEETKDLNILQFEGLDVSQIESEISFSRANNFDEARLLFLAGQKHLNAAKQFYQLDGYVLNYVEIIQDHSQLFRYLTAFETDLERQCKMCKRRIDMLTEVLIELNPQHYLLICRQLTYEIGSVYGDMADLKMEIIKTANQDKPSVHQIKKINSLLCNSAKFFSNFIDSMKQEGKLPEKFDESLLRVALLAHVYLARAHAKQICATREERLLNQQKALDLYKFVVNYCDNDENGARAFQDELVACREMVDLLPFRLDQIGQKE
ncbi:KIF1-binding protein homolog [Dendronephthya gigantea]|uniref:KIF1-binding protein homolog n=1 Tax=Dendronephthya gigantea TaxID=151771 RepID=UPI00106D0446|nr:KIF1-binding protein homolog [Dendronephthya gigantea]